MIVSPLLSLFCLFLACGRPPGQDVNVLILMPESQFHSTFIQPVNVSFRLSNFGNVFLNKTLAPGENRIFLPKGPFQVSTVFFAEQVNSNENGLSDSNPATQVSNTVEEPFAYAHVQQDVIITKQTRSLEVHYPAIKPVEYRKFGFIFKEKIGKTIMPVANAHILIQDPVSETTLKNPLNGNDLKIVTDSNGSASADIPIIDLNENIRLLIPKNNKYAHTLVIPVEDVDNGFQFYEIFIDRNKITLKSLIGTDYYLDQTQTIGTLVESGKNPRFVDSITKNKFQEELTDMLKHSSEPVDILSPLLKSNMALRGVDPYIRSGRTIQIQCKPHNGAVYQTCDRYLSLQKLKEDFFPNAEKDQSFDFLFLDQDGYSIFSDKTSTREKPEIVIIGN